MANYNVSTVYRGVDKASPVMDKMARNALKNSQKVGNSFGKMASRAGAAVGRAGMNVAKYGIAAGVGLATYATKNAIQNMLEFESEMLNVRAITKSNEEQYRSMSDAAIGMAKESVFTSKQVAEGMKYLGIAGWETTKIIEGMPGVLQLAAATQSELAMTSDMLSDSMSAFRIEASKSTHVADVFAGVVTTTNTNLEQLKEAMKDAAPAAMDFNISVEETAAILGTMANNGIKGSRAGTSFRNMAMRLANPTKDARNWMKKLNVEVTDSEGNFRNILDVMDETREGLKGLTEKQQAQAKEALFGMRAISGVSAVLADQSGKVRELTNQYRENVDVAKNMAEIQLSGASGALKKMDSAWDALSVTLAQKVAPAMATIIEHVTSLLSGDMAETGKAIQKGNIERARENIKTGGKVEMQSPFPFMSDEEFGRGFANYRTARESSKKYGMTPEQEHAGVVKYGRFDQDAVNLYKDIYNAQKTGMQSRIKEGEKKIKPIRDIYDIKLKDENVKTPIKSFMEKVTKQENTLIIKAPKGTAEVEGKIPKYLKMVETF